MSYLDNENDYLYGYNHILVTSFYGFLWYDNYNKFN